MDVLGTRRSGILLHPTSLAEGIGAGDLGFGADRFLEFLTRGGQSVWQMLPVGPPGRSHSPYDTLSAFAGSPALLSLELLAEEGLLRPDEIGLSTSHASPPKGKRSRADLAQAGKARARMLRLAWSRFESDPRFRSRRQEMESFRNAAGWLADYGLFQALSRSHRGRPWTEWERGVRSRNAAALRSARTQLAEEIRFHEFAQFVFDGQWNRLRALAAARGVALVGDVPIYVAPQSADVWAHPHLFDLTPSGRPRTRAGVPPDYFSRSGQLWGNPTYRWDANAREGYRWWTERIRVTLQRFDTVRLDHFIGFHRSWCVSGQARTARRGDWRPGPGKALFAALERELGPIRMIAEDLGLVTDEVTALREELGYPGMRVLQFAFGELTENAHLPHRYPVSCVAYTGTHDNPTLLGWFRHHSSARERKFALAYADSDGKEIHWDMIRLLLASVARTTVFPLQDVLGLGDDARMNRPGTARSNWQWRLRKGALTGRLADRLRELTERHGRCVQGNVVPAGEEPAGQVLVERVANARPAPRGIAKGRRT